MIELLLVALLLTLAALALNTWRYMRLRDEVELRARALSDKWRLQEVAAQGDERARLLLEEWTRREERRIRDDAIAKSRAVIHGQVTEHLLPFFPDFPYNPKDARFIGTPVDLIVFDGLSEGKVRQVVFIEVKTGRNGNLSRRERSVRDCIDAREVCYTVIHRPD